MGILKNFSYIFLGIETMAKQYVRISGILLDVLCLLFLFSFRKGVTTWKPIKE